MKKVLADINGVAGVRGSFICDNRGEVIANATPTGLDTVTLNGIGRHVTLTLAALETAGEAICDLDFTYEEARLVVRDLANAVLVVLCEPQVDIAMLRLTLNVAVAHCEDDGEIQSQFEARAAEKELMPDGIDETSWHLLKALGNLEPKEMNNA
jgi:predicted regulator of Ras-like GTPase activity (Roadblock/LC7/MglB family)